MADWTHPAHRWPTVRTRLCTRTPRVSQTDPIGQVVERRRDTHPWLLHPAHVLKDLLVTIMRHRRHQVAGSVFRHTSSCGRRRQLRTGVTYGRHLLVIERLANHDAFAACTAGKHASRFRRPDHFRSSAGRNHLDEFFEICARQSASHQLLANAAFSNSACECSPPTSKTVSLLTG